MKDIDEILASSVLSGVIAKNTPSRVHLKKRRFIICLFVILAAFIGCAFLYIANIHKFDYRQPEMATTQHAAKTVIGNLGGIQVEIPRYYVEYVEYDSDPGFGEKRIGFFPVRTVDSKLRAFGMDVRYPDMKGLVDEGARKEKRQQSLQEDTWLYVGISAGEDYPGDGFLDRRTRNIKGDLFDDGDGEFKGHWNYSFQRQPDTQHGLDAFFLSGIDPRTGKPARESEDTHDTFVHRLPTGRVDAFIQCGRTYVPGGVASCGMSSSLEPEAHVEVRVRFRRDLLPKWQSIQKSVHQLLLSFEVKAALVDVSRSMPVIPTAQ